jgi:hypothetical protein
MRIFTFAGLDFGFSERYCRKLSKNCAKYSISIEEKSDGSKLGNEQIGLEDSDLGELHILALGFKPTAANASLTVRKFRSEKLRVKKASEFKLLGRFSKPTKDTPIPLLCIYKKLKKQAIADELIKLLSTVYVKLTDCYTSLQLNLATGPYWQAFAEYESEIKALGEALFIKVNDKFSECIRVQGFLLDQFFITRQQREIFLEDTLHMPSVEKKDLNITVKNNNEFGFTESQSEVSSDSVPAEITVSFSTSSLGQTSSENSVDIQSCSELNKTQAERFILVYQRHLSANYFFRCKKVGEEKLAHTNRLLDTLRKEPLANFSKLLDEFEKATYLSHHRDKLLVQKIGHLFKGHNKSKGFQLIESLQNVVENELTFNFR